ncbi:MAG: glycerol-3-phosphate dehydrogenase/oxidase [Porticoccaceae bacterium]|nr:glycerol-3-phosphate dehydrogenase/oxidase [Porticoccaceae bacterium]
MSNHGTPLFTQRDKLLAEMRSGESLDWDIIIIGGGITGAGILREAVRRGYRALLIEQGDFSSGTSSRSSKMVHGGLRYLAAGDIKLTKESLTERERLLAEAPGLVERINFYFALSKGLFPGRWAMAVILTIYDFIAGIRDHRYYNNRRLGQRFPGLQQDHLNGAAVYSDAMVDDSRLVLRVLQESISAGGTAINYSKVSELLLDDNQIRGVVLDDPDAATGISLQAPVVINATGAWADRLRNQVNPEKRIRPLRGSHLIIHRDLMPVNDVLTSLHPEDKRGVYVYPWEGTTVIGTTDLDHSEDLDIEASIDNAEVDYLLQAFNVQFPAQAISRSDIISSWAGVRPVIGSESSKDPSRERRDHAVWSDNGLITVSGGKLTTFRLIALDALAAATARLPEAQRFTDERVFNSPQIAAEELIPEDPVWAQRLLGRYGSEARSLLDSAPPAEQRRIAGTDFCLAECRWAARHEAVVHLDDLMLRRTRLGMVMVNGGMELLPFLETICKSELSWDNDHWHFEVKRYLSIWQRFYSLPDTHKHH